MCLAVFNMLAWCFRVTYLRVLNWQVAVGIGIGHGGSIKTTQLSLASLILVPQLRIHTKWRLPALRPQQLGLLRVEGLGPP